MGLVMSNIRAMKVYDEHSRATRHQHSEFTSLSDGLEQELVEGWCAQVVRTADLQV